MKSDKQLKQEFKAVFSREYRSYYPVRVLEAMGYKRGRCVKCGKHFWSTNPKRNVCGDAACIGRYEFLERKITNVKLSYEQVWKKFARLFEKQGYKAIKRYPVVARWRDDTLYVKASIYDFQPHVTSGLSPPPAKKLVVPQTCLRFNDVDNVGVTMSHMTGFVMIGQHAFLPQKEWDQGMLFRDICTFLFETLKIPKQELIFHEDAWAGGGNLGACIEYFSGGVELGNQVYMTYEMTESGPKELKLKVLDMGMGQERVAWFTQQAPTIYDATFPKVLKKLIKATGCKINKQLLKKYVPYGAMLNLDEVSDVKKNIARIAQQLKLTTKQLEEFLAPTAALYSIAEHARSLLIALNDGSLPSNVGDAYNLRILFRRAQDLIEHHHFKVELSNVARWHAEELRGIFPKLSENIEDVKKILAVELKKYKQGKEKSRALVTRLLKSNKISTKKMVELYDSKGINPAEIQAIGNSLGIKVDVPKSFYALVSRRHEQRKIKFKGKQKLKVPNLKPTELLFYKSNKLEFKARVLAVLKEGIILNKTAFYPLGGGQENDTGTINGYHVENVLKVQALVIHKVKGSFKVGQEVEGKVDKTRRLQLTIHHTATHILNAAAREVLGNHVYQAGAKKTTEKARLDITHYEGLSKEQVKNIEKKANELIAKAIPIHKHFMSRAEAERRYGIRIYQGGYIPGKEVRIVEVEGLDVEACGGTHLDNTSEVCSLRIIKSSKIQDGVVRLEFVAGPTAKSYEKKCEAFSSVFGSLEETEKVASVFSVPVNAAAQTVERFINEVKQMGGRPFKVKNAGEASSLFKLWKQLNKNQQAAVCEMPGECAVKLVDAPPAAMLKAISKVKKALLVNKQDFFVFKGTDAEFAKLQKAGAKGGGREIKQGKFAGDLKKLKVFSQKV